MSEVLVWNDWSVLPKFNFLNCHGRNFSDQNSSQRVSKGRLSTDKVKDDLLFIKLLHSDVWVFNESSQTGLVKTIGLSSETCWVFESWYLIMQTEERVSVCWLACSFQLMARYESILTFLTWDSVTLARFFISSTACAAAWSDTADFFLSEDLDVFLAGLSAVFEVDRFYFAADDISIFFNFILSNLYYV